MQNLHLKRTADTEAKGRLFRRRKSTHKKTGQEKRGKGRWVEVHYMRIQRRDKETTPVQYCTQIRCSEAVEELWSQLEIITQRLSSEPWQNHGHPNSGHGQHFPNWS